MPQLSATTLKLFQECPRCFWLRLNRNLERPRGPFPSLPSGIDRVLKSYFDRYRQTGQLPPLVAGALTGRLATHPLTLGFDDPGSGTRLWGKLDDSLLLPDGRVAPLDHKTRASAPEDRRYTETYYQFQMDVYTLLLERNGHRVSRTAFVVYYFPVEGALHDGFPFRVAVHEIATHPERAYEIFGAACRCLTQSLPPIGQACEFCRWADARASHHAAAGPPSSARPVPPPADAPAAARVPPASTGGGIPSDLFADTR